MADNPLEQLYASIAPYLPSSFANPIHQLITLPKTLLDNPAQLIPLLVSLVTIYAAVVSAWNTARMALRALWFTMKWGAIIAAVTTSFSSYKNWGNPDATNDSLETVGRIGKTALGLGKQGANWWVNSGDSQRSASGRPRRWAATSGDDGWKDSGEQDDDMSDPIKAFQETVLTFLRDAPAPSSQDKKKRKLKKKTKGKAKPAEKGGGLSGWATTYALQRAKGMWDDLVEGNGT